MPTTSSSQNVPDRAATLWQPETEHRQPRYLHMSTDSKSSDAPEAQSNARKDPDAWVTGDESMTGAQASYLKTLCDEAGEAFDPRLTKAKASKHIDELQAQTGRGRDH
jgi:hypothetical protein